MNSELRYEEPKADDPQPSSDLTSAPIRIQLLWSSFFPLALFGLLSTLVITNAFYRLSLDLVTQRNTAQVQAVAMYLEQDLSRGANPGELDLQSALQQTGAASADSAYILDIRGIIVNSAEEAGAQSRIDLVEFAQTRRAPGPSSRLLQSPANNDEVMVSAATIPGTDYQVVLVEPWAGIMAPAAIYQILLSGLTILGVFLSLLMLSLAIRRIIQPITTLTKNATRAIPGSIFRPIQESGPQEIRILIHAFNRMVIRLAEQQSALRKLAHKSLLSQEEERQRLSHELHDGTLQDLVGLSQRVELCQNEMNTDPQAALERLKEIHNLLGHTLADVRSISIALRPPLLDELGLVVAIDSLCKKMSQSNTGMQCQFNVSGKARRLAPDLELAVYRVAQEALTNIRKHAPDATRIQVDVAFGDNDIRATISNNGTAFSNQDIQENVRKGHIGLAGMYERARLFGGSLNIRSNASEDTVVTLELPYLADSIST